MPLDAREFESKMQRLDGLLRRAEEFPDPAARTHMVDLARAVLDLHGTGFQRVLEHLEAGGAAAEPILQACAADKVVSGLLLLHGIHPLDQETRVRQALEEVRPYLRSHGGNVEIVEIEEGFVRLRLEGSCHGCPSSAMTMRQTIEEAILRNAPDVAAVEVEGVIESAPSPLPLDAGLRVALPVV